ncbi:MAG: diol dehydratase reactivase ATPase-like domain-containing protein [Actinomycetes bacterium]
MTVIAGVDIGNSTTEIVLSVAGLPQAWDRRPTRGHKGSLASVQAAAALLRNIERSSGLHADRVIVAPWHPVTSDTATVHEAPPHTGRFEIVECASHSVVGNSHASAPPWILSHNHRDGAVIALIPSAIDFSTAAQLLNSAVDNGMSIVGIAVEQDEAVLIAARISVTVPIVDRIDIQALSQAQHIFIEVRPAGSSVTTATDVWALSTAFNARDDEREYLAQLARWVNGERAVVIAAHEKESALPARSAVARIHYRTGEWHELFSVVAAASPVGIVKEIDIPGLLTTSVSDMWAVDIIASLTNRGIRTRSHSRTVAVATLAQSAHTPTQDLEAIFGIPVAHASSEADAAARGARTTPGISEHTVIIDIGGGTIDLISDTAVVAAGAGDLLTAAVAYTLDVPRGAADWIKRGPAQRVEAPTVVLTEDGAKTFVDQPIAATLTGSLVAMGPSGYLAFGSGFSPAEWRIARQGLKASVIAANVERIVSSAGLRAPVDVIVVGGPAADDELVPLLSQLPSLRNVGRGNVAGKLGHRYAVAYGLTLNS